MTPRDLLSLFLASIALAAPSAASAQSQPPAPPSVSAEVPAPAASGDETGLAAVYSDKLHGRKTASGKIYDRNALTAAHKTLPFGSKVRVTNLKNKRSVVVTINDRGPTQAGRVLDLSPRAAEAIGIGPRGMAEVSVAAAKQMSSGSDLALTVDGKGLKRNWKSELAQKLVYLQKADGRWNNPDSNAWWKDKAQLVTDVVCDRA